MRQKIILLAILILVFVIAACTRSAGPAASTAETEGTVAVIPGQVSSRTANEPVIGAYWFLYPNPDDDTYSLVMQEKEKIPWTKINRLYIAFATVKGGVLADLPTGDSPEDAARREEMQRRIREIVALGRQNNPDLEIFIVSNFGDSLNDEYLAAAQDPDKFAGSVSAYLKEYDLDGYDMDWESGNIDDYSPQLTTLLAACHERLAADGKSARGRPYLLTHTVWPGVESAATVAGLAGSVDQLNLMTYGTGDKYDLPAYAASYNASGFPYDRMIGGIESERGYSDGEGPDTQESVAAKCAFTREHGMAGLFEWRIDNDMRPDGETPSYRATGWMHDCLAG